MFMKDEIDHWAEGRCNGSAEYESLFEGVALDPWERAVARPLGSSTGRGVGFVGWTGGEPVEAVYNGLCRHFQQTN